MLKYIAVVCVVLVPSPSQAQSWCASRTDEHASGLLAYMRSLGTKAHAESDAARKAIGMVRVDSSAIRPVGEESICQKAAASLNRYLHLAESTARSVYVVKAGPVYWVEDPAVKAGEYIRALIVDSTLTKVLGIPGR